MSQYPAHAPRRALSPPAVTRFQLITPTAAETVFAPPYMPPRGERLRYSSRRSVPPVVYAPTEREPDQIEHSSWRDILARLDLGASERERTPEAATPEPADEFAVPGEAVQWEVEAFTAPGYTPAPTNEPVDEIPELFLDTVVGPRGDAEQDHQRDDATGSDFPLNAFIVPPGTGQAPVGYEADIARRVAGRLEALAIRLRTDGLAAIGDVAGDEELSRVLAAILTGYTARDP